MGFLLDQDIVLGLAAVSPDLNSALEKVE